VNSMKIYKCDHCLKITETKDLVHIVGYPIIREKRCGYKAKLRADICFKCFNEIFGGK